MVEVGDKYILHSENGLTYKIEIANVNMHREPNQLYAIDMWEGTAAGGFYDGACMTDIDYIFVGDEFLSKCEKVED